MALAINNLTPHSAGSELKRTCALAFDNSYPTGGEAFTAAQFGLTHIRRMKLQPEQGYDFEVDYTARKIKAFYSGANAHAHSVQALSTSNVIQVGHDATATDNHIYMARRQDGLFDLFYDDEFGPDVITLADQSTLLFFHIRRLGISQQTTTIVHNANPPVNLAATQVFARAVGHNEYILVSVNNGNAHVSAQFATGIDRIPIYDDNAAGANNTDIPLYFDEDATIGTRLKANLPSLVSGFITCASGRRIPIFHTANAAVDGVVLYVDDDSAQTHQRFAFVSPTTTNGTLHSLAPSSGMLDLRILGFDQLYFDHDGGTQLLYNNAGIAGTMYSRHHTSNNPMALIAAHSANAAVLGVTLHMDTGVPRLEGNMPGATNQNLALQWEQATAASIGQTAAEVQNGGDLSALSAVECEVYGF